MTQTIVLLGGGIDSLGIVTRAIQMRLKVIVVDRDPDAPARKLAHEFIEASCYHEDQVLSALFDLKIPVHGVLCAGTDAPHVMAAVAGAYALVGPSNETAALSRDKLAQTLCLESNGVWIPQLFPEAQKHVLEFAHIVIKPIDSRGGRGVLRIETHADQGVDLRPFIRESTAASPTGRSFFQRWIDGQQISSESLVQNGEILWTAYADRNYDRLEEFAPYVIEDGCDMPSSIPAVYENDWQQKAAAQLRKCVEALKLKNGVLKGDLVWDGHDIWVIEVATRLSGGRMCSDITPAVWGVDFVGMAIRIALGDYIWPGEINPYLRRYASQRFSFPSKPTAHPDRGPHVIGYGTTRQEAQKNAAKQLKQLESKPNTKVQEPV